MLLQPRREIAQHRAEVRGPVRRSAETICVTCAPAIVALTTSSAVCTPPVAASDARTRPDRMASQCRRRSSSDESESAACAHQLLRVDVGLVEPVENDQPVGAGAIELPGEWANAV